MKAIQSKIFLVAIITIMLLSGTKTAYSADIYISDVKCSEEDTVTIPVFVDNAPNEVMSFGGKLVYDTDNLIFIGKSAEGTLSENFAFANAYAADGKVTFGGFDMTGFAAGTSGTLINLIFRVDISCTYSPLALQELVDDIRTWSVEN